MHRLNDRRLATHGMAAVLFFCIAFADAAAQVMRRLPKPAPQPTVVAPVQKQPTPPAPSGGVAQLSPAAVCASNPAPRIGNIDGTQSGIVFQPGSQLNIAGCGFGRNGQVYLSSGGITVPLKIDSWSESNIHATIDPALGGLQDFGGVTVNVKPNGLAVVGSIATNSFKAARAQFVLAIPPGVAGMYSMLYGPPTTNNTGSYSPSGGTPTPSGNTSATGAVAGPRTVAPTASTSVFTTISRSKYYSRFCPAATDQSRQMTDSWPVDFLAPGFDVVGVNYTNHTMQKNWDTQKVQWVQVGGSQGDGRYDAMQKRVFVTWQGNSMYVKQTGALEMFADLVTMAPNLIEDLKRGGGSACTSSYTVSLTVSGPRGISPFK